MKRKLDEINKKWDEWIKAEQAFDNQPLLRAKRELLEEKIDSLKAGIKKRKITFDSGHETGEELGFLNQLTKEIRAIDLILDESEELTRKDLYTMREHLLHEIGNVISEGYEEQLSQWNEIKTGWMEEGEIRKLLEITHPLQGLVEHILVTRSKIKGKGLLSYIFGISPNAIIERHLATAGHLIQENMFKLEEAISAIERESLRQLIRRIHTLCEDFHTHSGKQWGFRHIDTIVADASKQFDEVNKLLEKELTLIQQRREQLEERVNSWLEVQIKGN